MTGPDILAVVVTVILLPVIVLAIRGGGREQRPSSPGAATAAGFLYGAIGLALIVWGIRGFIVDPGGVAPTRGGPMHNWAGALAASLFGALALLNAVLWFRRSRGPR